MKWTGPPQPSLPTDLLPFWEHNGCFTSSLLLFRPGDWLQPGPYSAANSRHRPHCILTPKKTRHPAQQLAHETLIPMALLKGSLTGEGMPNRSDGKTLAGQPGPGHATGRAPGTCSPSAFPTGSCSLVLGILGTSQGTPMKRRTSLHL